METWQIVAIVVIIVITVILLYWLVLRPEQTGKLGKLQPAKPTYFTAAQWNELWTKSTFRETYRGFDLYTATGMADPVWADSEFAWFYRTITPTDGTPPYNVIVILDSIEWLKANIDELLG